MYLKAVHDEIRKHLHDEMDVNAYQQDVVSVLDGDGTSMRCLGGMAEGGSMTSSMSSDVKLR